MLRCGGVVGVSAMVAAGAVRAVRCGAVVVVGATEGCENKPLAD